LTALKGMRYGFSHKVVTGARLRHWFETLDPQELTPKESTVTAVKERILGAPTTND